MVATRSQNARRLLSLQAVAALATVAVSVVGTTGCFFAVAIAGEQLRVPLAAASPVEAAGGDGGLDLHELGEHAYGEAAWPCPSKDPSDGVDTGCSAGFTGGRGGAASPRLNAQGLRRDADEEANELEPAAKGLILAESLDKPLLDHRGA